MKHKLEAVLHRAIAVQKQVDSLVTWYRENDGKGPPPERLKLSLDLYTLDDMVAEIASEHFGDSPIDPRLWRPFWREHLADVGRESSIDPIHYMSRAQEGMDRTVIFLRYLSNRSSTGATVVTDAPGLRSRRLQLSPPANWQDFEDLCLALWRQVWSDPTAQKHGRSGQRQAGVDIFGRSGSQEHWAGIQCKVGHLSLTAKEVHEQVQKARSFHPQLSQYTLATTAYRDATTQDTVRAISDQNVADGSFPVSLACWDDIVELLHENPSVISVFYPIEQSQVAVELAKGGLHLAITVEEATVKSLSALTNSEAEAREEWLANVARNHRSTAVRRSALVALRKATSTLLRPISLIVLDAETNQNLRETAIKNLGVCGTREDLQLLKNLEVTESISRFGKQAAAKAHAVLSKRIASTGDTPTGSAQPLFDVAVSFAGEDRTHAHAIAEELQRRSIRVFYDGFYQADLIGEDLSRMLGKIYSEASLFCLVLVSRHYASKRWTTFELTQAQERAISEDAAYIIPVRLDDAKVASLAAVTGFLDLRAQSVEDVCDVIATKITSTRRGGKPLAEQLGLRKPKSS